MADAEASDPEKSVASDPPLTPADAAVLIDALVGYGAALTAHSRVDLPSLNDFVR